MSLNDNSWKGMMGVPATDTNFKLAYLSTDELKEFLNALEEEQQRQGGHKARIAKVKAEINRRVRAASKKGD
jgi:uncharacterized small protein (DUF1192 family)